MKRFTLLLFLACAVGCVTGTAPQRFTGPWNLKALRAVPAVTWGQKTNLTQEVYYEGEPFQRKPTRIFAYYGRPAEGNGPFPAMLLVHGGGGKAFREWAEHWAERGYVALAKDLAGNGPNGRFKFAQMSDAQRKRWVENFDPSKYLSGVRCPILFLNGSNDFAYPLDSYQKSYRQVSGPMTLSVKIRLPHGHIWTFNEVDYFVDGVLKGGEPLPTLKPMKIPDGVATTSFNSKVPVTKAELNCTSEVGEWQKRLWKTVPAEMVKGQVTARLPLDRPLVCYLSITDERKVTVSTPHVTLPIPSAP